MNKFRRISVVLSAMTAAAAVMSLNVSAYTLTGWDLVDSGKHMDWDGSTNYMTEWYNAVNTWNAYKPGVIRADRWDVIEDVSIRDRDAYDGSVLASTSSSGTITFYHDTMDSLTTTQRQATITHEIGHALGLGHVTASNAIMRQGVKNFTSLSSDDKNGYDAAYKKYS